MSSTDDLKQQFTRLLEEDEEFAAEVQELLKPNGGPKRRDLLKAGGVLGAGAMLGGGAATEMTGSAKADPQGQIGTSSDPVDQAYIDSLDADKISKTIHVGSYPDIDSAFADFPTEGRHIHIDEGSYTVQSPPLQVDAPFLITGDGWDNNNEVGSIAHVSGDAKALECTETGSYRGAAIKDVGFFGPGSSNSTSHGVDLGDANGPYLENVVVDGFGDAGINLGGGTFGMFNRCWSLNNGRGLAIGGTNLVQILGGRYNLNANQGIHLHTDINRGVAVRGADISANNVGLDVDNVSADSLLLWGAWAEQNAAHDVRLRPGSADIEGARIHGQYRTSSLTGDNLTIGEGGTGSIDRVILDQVVAGGTGRTIQYGSNVRNAYELFPDNQFTINGKANVSTRASKRRGWGWEFSGSDNPQVFSFLKPNNGNVVWKATGNKALELVDSTGSVIFDVDERNGNIGTMAGRFATGSPIQFFDGLQAEGGGATYGNGVVQLGTGGARFEVNGSGEVVVYDEAGNETVIS